MTSAHTGGRLAGAVSPLHPSPASGATAATGALLALGFGALVLVVQRFDAPLVLLAGVALLFVLLLLARPELATLLTVFLLYTNVPSILSKRHGVPVPVAGLFILLLGIPLLRLLVIRHERFRVDTTFRLMLVYLGVILLSTLVARDAQVSIVFVVRFLIEGLLVYLLVLNVVRTRATLRRVIWTMLAAGSLLGALTLYQEVTGSFRQEFGGLAERNYEFGELRQLAEDDPEARELLREFTETHGTSERSQRANGPLDEPNRYGQIMVVLLPLAVLAYRSARSATARGAAVVAALLVTGAVVFTNSRGAFVTIVLLAAIAGCIRWVSRTHLLVGAVAGALLVPVAVPEYATRVATLVGVTTLGEARADAEIDGALKGRAAAMTAATLVFFDHPVLGVGAGQFQPFYSAEYQQTDPERVFRTIRSYHAHSLYLQLVAELGVLGLASFLAIFVYQLRELDRARRRWRTTRPELADIATAIGLSIVAYLFTSLFLHFGGQRYLWLPVALGSATLYLLRAAAVPPETSEDGR